MEVGNYLIQQVRGIRKIDGMNHKLYSVKNTTTNKYQTLIEAEVIHMLQTEHLTIPEPFIKN